MCDWMTIDGGGHKVTSHRNPSKNRVLTPEGNCNCEDKRHKKIQCRHEIAFKGCFDKRQCHQRWHRKNQMPDICPINEGSFVPPPQVPQQPLGNPDGVFGTAGNAESMDIEEMDFGDMEDDDNQYTGRPSYDGNGGNGGNAVVHKSTRGIHHNELKQKTEYLISLALNEGPTGTTRLLGAFHIMEEALLGNSASRTMRIEAAVQHFSRARQQSPSNI